MKNNWLFKNLSIAFIAAQLFITSGCGTLESGNEITDDRYNSEAWKLQFAWLKDQEDADFLLYVRRMSEAEKLAKMAIARAKKFNEDDPRLARSLTSLGRIFLESAKYQEALVPLEKARRIKTEKFGKNSADVADILTEISYANFNLGNLDKARANLDKARAIRKVINDNFSTIDSDLIEGLILDKENRHEEALKKFLSCIETYNQRMEEMPDSISTEQMNRMTICFQKYISIQNNLNPGFDTSPFKNNLEKLNRWLRLLGNSNA